MGLFNKKELEKIQELENENIRLKNAITDYNEFTEKLDAKKEELKKARKEYSELIEMKESELKELVEDRQNELDELSARISEKEMALTTDIKIVDFEKYGIFEPTFNLKDTNEYKEKLKECKKEQKKIVKNWECYYWISFT